MEPVTLTTERLVLRPFEPADVEAVYSACQDPDIQYYTPAPTPYRRTDAEAFVLQRAPRGWETDSDYNLGGFLADGGALVGSFGLEKKDQGVYELGYWAVREHRGRGLTTEAARALCDWGWESLDVHRMEWWAAVGNWGSRKVAEKLGFTVEGMLRKRGHVGGQPHDWWVGGLLR